MFTVYILKSEKDFGYYIGYTEDLERRLSEHNGGKTRSLRHRLPMKVVYTEIYQTKKEAKAREVQIKSYKGGKAFQELIIPGSPRHRRD